ncbi:MAG: transposase [Candidatus Altiarchaeales archaeon]|nr:transposase [Candidatus Altiarchaeales archaeon]
METQFLTAVFKIHNPSSWRKKVLDKTIREYTANVKSLLFWAEANLEHLEQNGVNKRGKYTARTLQQMLPPPAQATMASALKAGLVSNVAMMLASYLSLKNSDSQDTTGFPKILEKNGLGYSLALDRFTKLYLDNDVTTSKEEAERVEDVARAELMRLSKNKSLPIHFCRSRDFTILVDIKQQRLFLYLKLTLSGDPDNLQTNIDGENLVDISTGEIFTKRSGVGVLFPLEVGKKGWLYDQFIVPSVKQRAHPKAAKLIRKNDEYFLHVSFAFDCPDPYEPESYLGVDRGVFFTASYAVVDQTGAVIDKDRQPDGYRDAKITAGKRVQDKQRKGQRVTAKDYRGKYLDSFLHIITNRLVEVALQHQSMIVMENLNIRIRGKFYKSAWKKLHWIVEYKAKLAGVPIKKGGVWAAYTSKLCIHCGEIADRPERDTVVCSYCGHTEHADEAAAVNIARRAMYRKKEWGGTDKKPGDWRAFHRSFANEAGFVTKIDLRQEKRLEQLSLF